MEIGNSFKTVTFTFPKGKKKKKDYAMANTKHKPHEEYHRCRKAKLFIINHEYKIPKLCDKLIANRATGKKSEDEGKTTYTLCTRIVYKRQKVKFSSLYKVSVRCSEVEWCDILKKIEYA